MAEAAVTWAIDKLEQLLTGEVKLLKGVHKEIVDIKDELESMKSFLKDADARMDQGGVESGFKTWAKQVREVAYRIEDVIDEYMIHLARNTDHHGFLRSIQGLVNKLKPRRRIASQIQEIKKSVSEIRERSDRYSLNSSSEQESIWHDPRMASLFVEETELVGIESPKNELISMLVDQEISKTKVVSVVGMGGLGKTTLAKKVYDSHMVVSHFDCHAWITVSQSYKTVDVLRTMITEFQLEKLLPAFDGMETMGEVLLIRKLRDYLSEKRYVVVFDDVWRGDFWGYMKIAFPDNDKGSRIIFTTRNEDVAPSANESSLYHVYKLQPLPRDKAFGLFCKKAFQSNEGCCPFELLELSHAIVGRCEGLPLAIVTIGGLLATKDKTVSEWQKFYKSLSSSLASDQRLTSIAKILSLSFHDLPCYLKSCFLYLSLFPEDYSVRCSRLIRLWMAAGFIKESHGMTLEDTATEYLIELIHRNLVQVARISVEGKARACLVHDLIRETILCHSRHLSFNQVSNDNFTNLKGKSRHLSIYNEGKGTTYGNSNCQTHSIIVFDIDGLPKSFISSVNVKFKLLRSLDLEGAPLDHISEELGNLWHLRYLSLSRTNVRTLPRSIGNLCNLETLDLRASFVYDLPIEINRLLKLRHLQAWFHDTNDEFNLGNIGALKIHGNIECLKALQTLSLIEVDHDTNLIRQLKALTQMQKFGIGQLKRENGSALCSAIEKMTCLRTLAMVSINGEEYLDLQSVSDPPPHLQRLYLYGPLLELPNWISKLTSLFKLDLSWSRLGDGTLQVLQTLPNLLQLGFYEGYSGERLHFQNGSFQKLRVVRLRSLMELSELMIDEGALPLVEELEIGPCPKLKEVPSGIHFLRNLERLRFYDIQREFAVGMQPDGGHDYWKVKHVPVVNFMCKIRGNRYEIYKLGDSTLRKRLERE